MIQKIIFLFLFSLNIANADDYKDVSFALGESLVYDLDFEPSTNVRVDKDTIANVVQIVPKKKQIVFSGLKAGTTTVLIRDDAGEIREKLRLTVTMNNLSKTVETLGKLLVDIEGIKVSQKGDNVFVTGEIVVPDDVGRINLLLGKYDNVISLVELSPQTQILISKKMQDEIQRNGMKDVTVRVVNKTFWLEGVVTSESQRDDAVRIATVYIPDKIESLARRTDSVQKVQKEILQNFITVNPQAKPPPVPKMVKVTAQFVELSKDYNKVFGFKWTPLLAGDGGSISFGPDRGTGGLTTSSGNGTLSGTISNLFPKLASAKSAGYARVIQSGMVLIKDKDEGTISKSEKKTFAVGTGEFTKATEASSDFRVNVKPAILGEEKVEMGLAITVSTLVGSPPATLSNNVTTKVVIKAKETAVIGGMSVDRTSTDYDRDPPGGADVADGNSGFPMFSFVRSKNYNSAKSQFVVFITPEIVENASEGIQEIKRKFRGKK